MEANSREGGDRGDPACLEWSHRLVQSNGTLREEEDRQNNNVNYQSIFNKRSGYKYNDLFKLRLASIAPQFESDAKKQTNFL